MIVAPKITMRELECFSDKKVVIFGYTRAAKKLCDCFLKSNITVLAFCTGTDEGAKRGNADVLSLTELSAKLELDENVILQPVAEKCAACALFSEANSIEMSDIVIEKWLQFFEIKRTMSIDKTNINYIYKDFLWKIKCSQKTNIRSFIYNLNKPTNPLLICLPMKTADYTLNYTFDQINAALQTADNGLSSKIIAFNNRTFEFESNPHKFLACVSKLFQRTTLPIGYLNVGHRARLININRYEKKFGTVKIITAVREPISQNLSSLYQGLASGDVFKDWLLGDLYNSNETGANNLKALLDKDRIDMQQLWELYIDRYVYPPVCYKKQSTLTRTMQYFLPEFKEHVIDITRYPFDKKKGFGIMKAGSVEVFVYQLEKLNDIIPELSAWVGVPFDSLINANKAADKWVGESYKQAQKEIKISQEYFDKCFNEPYVQHCYSEEDIEKFKKKWSVNINSVEQM